MPPCGVNCASAAAAAAAAETTAGEVQQRREGEETLHQCNQFIFYTSNSQACHKVSHVEHNWAILGRRGGLASAQAAQCELSGTLYTALCHVKICISRDRSAFLNFYRTQVTLGSDLCVQVSLSLGRCAHLTAVTLADEDTK